MGRKLSFYPESSHDVFVGQGNSICVAPYTLCALAFTGGLTNTTVIAQMQEDNGNCASVFEPNCIGDLKGALGNAVLEAGNGDLTSHEICASISGAVKIPGSCASIGSLLNRSSSGGTSISQE